jgi:PAS domain S-box-containing protein
MTVVALVIGGRTLYYVEDRLVASTGESLALAASDIADKLDLLLAERYGDIQMMAQAKVFHERDVAAMTAHLHALREAYPVYAWLGVTDAQGRIIAATDPTSVGQDRSGREWFRFVRNRDAVHVRDAQPSEDSGGVMAVSFTAPIRSPGGAFLGAVTTRMGLPVLEDVFARTTNALQAQYGTRTRIEHQFLQRDGTVIADSLLREEGTLNLKQLGMPSALSTDSAQPGYAEEMHFRRQVPVVTGYAQTEQHGNYYGLHWGVLVRMDREDILAPTRMVLWKVGAAGASVFVPMLGFLLWSTGRLWHEWALAQEETAHAAKAEAEARESDARTRLIINTAPDAIVIVNGEGRIVLVNTQAERLFGYRREELLDQEIEHLLPDRFHSNHLSHRRGYFRDPHARAMGAGMELYGRHKDGREFPVEISLSPLETKDGVLAISTIRDITERKQLAQRTRQLAKTEILAQILDGIAHELKNPLFIVTGNLQLLKEKLGRLETDDSLVSNLHHIEEAARRMDAIVRKFMLLTKPEKSQAVPCSVQPALQESLDMLVNDLMKRRITVTTWFAPQLPHVLAEPVQLREVFLNLILNAAQAMEAAHGQGKLRVSADGADGWVEVRFQDDGPGVPQEYQAKIFEPFFSTKPLHEGTGLGLWTVRSILMGLKGEVRCESEPGSGATFIVRLPGIR